MRTYRKFVQSPFCILKQTFILVLITFVAVTLFPFVKYKTSGQTERKQESQASAAFTGFGLPTNLLGKAAPHLKNPWNSQEVMAYFDRISCEPPVIPQISTTPESEAKTVKAINLWIDCHYAWNADLKQLARMKNTANNETKQSLNAIFQELLREDEIKLERIRVQYVEWKKNSLDYKHRLSFRHNLISDSNSDTH